MPSFRNRHEIVQLNTSNSKSHRDALAIRILYFFAHQGLRVLFLGLPPSSSRFHICNRRDLHTQALGNRTVVTMRELLRPEDCSQGHAHTVPNRVIQH